MEEGLPELSVAVLGGDRREVEASRFLSSWGANVRVCGLPRVEFEGSGDRCPHWTSDPREAVSGSDLVLCPVRGLSGDGYLFSMPGESPIKLDVGLMGLVRPGATIVIGKANERIRNDALRLGVNLQEIRDRDDFAIYNSIPTAEGAIQVAMEELPITIDGSSSFVLGYGRTGETMARKLKALGATTTVVARRDSVLAWAEVDGHRAVPFERLGEFIGEAQIIFNTVPALVLDRQLLSSVRVDCLIIDLASEPGGVDFKAAEEMGIKALLLPGLPGKVAPRTAGLIVAKLALRLCNAPLFSAWGC